MNKKVLFIVGGFNKGGGSIRVVKLLKYLPFFDINGVVLTKRSNDEKFYVKYEDYSIYRTKAFDVGKVYQKIKKIFYRIKLKTDSKALKSHEIKNDRLSDKFLIPDSDIFWALNAFFFLSKIIKKESINIIYSSSPHASSHIVAFLFRKLMKTRIPWIVEFRDPWTFNPFVSKKNFLLEYLNKKLEKNVLEECSKIIVTSMDYKVKFLNKYNFLVPEKIVFVPNGYDSDDFSEITSLKVDSKCVKIVHAGEFYGKRSIKNFLMALNEFKQEFPFYANKLSVTQFGNLDPLGERYNEKYPNPIFRHFQALPHKKCLQELADADWLLLIPGPGSGTIPGKFYEYLAIGRPILCIVDEGPLIEYFRDHRLGIIASSCDVLAIKRALVELFESINVYKEFEINVNFKSQFDRKNIAEKISDELKSLL